MKKKIPRRPPTGLKLAVLAAGIRQVDLAREMGVGRSRVCHMLSGYRQPTEKQWKILGRALDQSVEELKSL